MTKAFQHPNPGGARPVDRIDVAMSALRVHWRANPDLRLAQIVLAATGSLDVEPHRAHLVEDGPLTEAINAMGAGTPGGTVTCHRLVPIAHAAFPSALMGPDDALSAWLSTPRPGLGPLEFVPCLTVDLAREVLADPTLPETGAVWVRAVAQAIDLTEADRWRPYDSVVVPTTHQVHNDLDALAEEVRGIPMMGPVATAIDMLLPRRGNTIDSYHSLLTDALGPDGFEIFDTYDDEYVRVPWEDVHRLAPNLRTRLVDVITGLLAQIPTPAEDDDFAARIPKTRILR